MVVVVQTSFRVQFYQAELQQIPTLTKNDCSAITGQIKNNNFQESVTITTLTHKLTTRKKEVEWEFTRLKST